MKVSDGQKFALIKLMSQFAKDRHERLWILSELIGRKIETTSDVELQEWRNIRNGAYPYWSDGCWEMGRSFVDTCNALCRRYKEEIIGQGQLFEAK